MTAERRRDAVAAASVALLVLAPFLRGLARGEAFFFRDLSRHFFPLRLFALEGLRAGELRYWNPLLHGGIPTPFPPVSSPLDLLQLLRPDEAGLSAWLVLHLVIAALGMFLLARSRECGPEGAAAAGVVYGLGGFALSTINLYVYVQALAWAPFVVLGLRRAAQGMGGVVLGSLAVFLALSTAGVEIVAQSLLFGTLLALERHSTRGALARVAAAGVLGAMLAAPTLFVMAGIAAASERGAGFPTSVVLAHSIHPMTYLQVLVSDLYGDTARLTDRWWGANFFPRGFPYFLSLYLGPLAVALAVAAGPRRGRRRVLLLVAVAAWAGLGRWGGLEGLVDLARPLHAFRFPTKLFFTVHLGVALLAGWSVDSVARADSRLTRRTALVLAGTGGLLVLLPLAPLLLARTRVAWFVEHFFPPGLAGAERWAALDHMLASARTAGAVALLGAALCALAARGLVQPRRAAILLALLAAGDLLRAGAGLNATVTASFFRPSPEIAGLVPWLRAAGRVYSCDVNGSAAYWAARARRPFDHEVWTFALLTDTLTPDANMGVGVATALSEDMTSLVPRAAVLEEDLGCGRPSALVPRLREAGVAHVLSVEPLDDPALRLLAVAAPPRIAPLAIHVYAVDGTTHAAPDALPYAAPWLGAGLGVAAAGALSLVVLAVLSRRNAPAPSP